MEHMHSQVLLINLEIIFYRFEFNTGYPLHRENRENGKKKSLSGKTHGIWKFCQNTGNLVCSSCEFPDSKGKRYFDICRENFQVFLRSWISLLSQFCVCNSHKSRKLAQGKFAVG